MQQVITEQQRTFLLSNPHLKTKEIAQLLGVCISKAWRMQKTAFDKVSKEELQEVQKKEDVKDVVLPKKYDTTSEPVIVEKQQETKPYQRPPAIYSNRSPYGIANAGMSKN